MSLFTAEEMQEQKRRQRKEKEEQEKRRRKDARAGRAAKEEGTKEDAAPLQAELNARQREAVECTGRAVAVIAGPGSGKTGTLISRLRHLLDVRRIPAGEITAVTFTNRAAEEMRGRMEGTQGEVWIGTFHAICSRFLQEEGLSFLVADEGLQTELAENALEAFAQKGTPVRFLRELSRVKNALDKPEEKNRRMYEFYQRKLREAGALDYDDLLLETLKILEGLPEDAPQRFRFSYLLIDEFQDINPLQYRLVKEWGRGGKELFVIGDPDQSIYGFRGSDSECFTRLAEEYPQLETVRLQENYRCTPDILHAALGLISRNQGVRREMTARRKAGFPVRIVTAEDEWREAIFVAKEINRQIGGIDMLDTEENGKAEGRFVRGFSDMAVLYRTHRQAAALEKCLGQEGIPYIVAGREDFLSEREVRATLYFFRQAVYEKEEASLELCRKLLRPWLGEEEEALFRLIGKYRKKVKKAKPVKLLEEWAEEIRFEKGEAMKKLADMSVLYPTMEAFLHTLTFGEDGDVRRNGGRKFTADAVTLMTLHGSKGLEFPVVFLYGMDQGRIPLEFGGSAAEDLEEERRLCYVGMTRAEEELILTCGRTPSRFLQEIPAENIRRERAEGAEEKETVRMVQMSLFDMI